MSSGRVTLGEVLRDLRDQVIEECAQIADEGGGCGEHREFASGMDAAANSIAERIRKLRSPKRST